MVGPVELAARGSEVVDGQLETVEPDARNNFQPFRRPDLVLGIDRGDRCLRPIVRVTGNWSEGHQAVEIDRRIAERYHAGAWRKEGGGADIAGPLATEFEAEQQCLVDAAKPVFPDEVSLAEQILAGRAIVVAIEGHGPRALIEVGREDVLIEFVEVTVGRPIAEREAVTQFMLDRQHADMGVDLGKALVGVAEEDAVEALQRLVQCHLVGDRWDAAIGSAAVVEIFVAEVDPGPLTRLDSDRRIHTVAFQVNMVPEAVAILIKAIDPDARYLTQRLVDVGCQPEAAFAVARQRETLEIRLGAALGDPVDDAAAAAAAEDHCVGALQDLDAVDIVEIAEILDVVAHTVDEKVGGAAVAPEHDGVAIAFARVHAGAGNQVEDVGDRTERLIRDLLGGDYTHRLRHVLERGAGLGRGAGFLGLIAAAVADNDDRISLGRLHILAASANVGSEGRQSKEAGGKQGSGRHAEH